MWGPIIQFLTIFGGGIAVATVLEDHHPVIVHTTPTPPPIVASSGDTLSPWLIIAIAILVFAAGYVIRVFRRQG